MSEYKETYPSKTIRFDNPFAYVTLTNFGENRGLLQLHTDWGTYSYFWGAMGDCIEKFLAGCDQSYVHNKLRSSANYQGMKKEYQQRLDKFIIASWPAIKAHLIKPAEAGGEGK